MSAAAAAPAVRADAQRLLRAGFAAGPVYVLLGILQLLVREGFDPRRHALSLMANGPLGWVQVLNFFLTGALVIAGAIGIRRLLRGVRGGRWGALLLGVYGIALIGAGFFRADPAPDFPPGSTFDPSAGFSTSGLLHFVFGAIGFYALIAACFVFARRFASIGRRAWMLFSIVTGAYFFASFGALASGTMASGVMLAFWFAVLLSWIWHALLMRELLAESSAL